jgi:hypothetical protein
MVLPVCAGACDGTMSEAFGFRKGNGQMLSGVIVSLRVVKA